MLNEHYLDLLSNVAALTTELGEDSDVAHAERVEELLRQVDLVHREGLLRLVEALRAEGAGDALDRAVERDSVVRILLGLYGLAELNLPPEAEVSPENGAKPATGFFPMEQLRVRRPDSRASAGDR